jgi:hypothetical protein
MGNCLLAAKQIDDHVTELRMINYRRAHPDDAAVQAWKALKIAAESEGWSIAPSEIVLSELLPFAVQNSLIKSLLSEPEPATDEWKSKQLMELSRESPMTPLDQRKRIVDEAWQSRRRLLRWAKKEAAENQAAHSRTLENGVAEFFESLRLESALMAGDRVNETLPAEQPRPWDIILNVRDQSIVRMWWEGLTAEEIGAEAEMRPQSIHNKLAHLRKKYGRAIVPLKKDM